MTTRRRPNRRIASVLMTLALVGGLLSVAAPAQAAGVTVSGTVRGVDGGGTIPLHGALVGFYPLTGSGDPFGFALTNVAGAYSIQDVPAGQYRVRFDPPNTTHAATWLFGQPLEYSSVLLNVTTTPVTGVNTTLPLGSIVSGTVSVDGSLGGATVEVTLFRLDPSGRIDRFPLRARSLTNGNFNIQGVPPGSYQLRFATDTVEIATTYWSGAQLRTDAGTIVISTPGTYGSFAGVVSTSTGAPTIGRLAGADRYSTAVEISKAGWPFGADALFIVSGQGFADALSAGAAASSIDAPMLLVTRDSVPEVVAAEITRLDPANVYVVGGESVISNQTFNDVLDFTGSVTLQRIAGADRYKTSRIVSARFFDNSTFAYLATGTNFPDALGAGPAARSTVAP